VTNFVNNAQQNYARDGFAITPAPLLNIDLLRRAQARIPSIYQGDYNTGIAPWSRVNLDRSDCLQRISQIHLCDKAIHELATSPEIGAWIAKHTGAQTVKIWGTQLYSKPPCDTSGANVGWHRDSQHITFYDGGVVTVWIPFGGSKAENGPLKYVTGSHQKNTVEQPHGAMELDIDAERIRLKQESSWKEVDVITPEGGFSLHHWDLIHGSADNHSPNTRHALSIGFATDTLEIMEDEMNFGFPALLKDKFYCPTVYG